MKAFLTFLCFASVASAGPTIVYVSESHEKRIAVWSLDEKTGELTRQSETALPGAPGSLALSPDHRYLYASVRCRLPAPLSGALALEIGLAVLQALRLPTGFGLKWPNDLYLKHPAGWPNGAVC